MLLESAALVMDERIDMLVYTCTQVCMYMCKYAHTAYICVCT